MTIAAAAPGRWAGLRVTARRSLGAVDVVVSVLLTIGGLVEVAHLAYAAPAAGVTSCVICTGSVAVRRRVPFTAALAAGGALAVYQIATRDPDGSFIAPAIVLVYYYAGRSAADRRAWKRLAALLGYGLAVNVLIQAATKPFSLPGALATWPIMLLPVAAGLVVARYAFLTCQLRDATASLHDEQRVRAARALGEERNRIARELHDVVAHHVSVMVIQAGAARLLAGADPATAGADPATAGAAGAALRVVEQSGREALTDLRRIMGVLRRGDPSDAALPAGLGHLDQLVNRTRSSGVPVDVVLSGRVDQVPAAVNLVAYRVVQEALTNVVKHARPATARIMISVSPHMLEVTVSDNGVQSAAAGLPSSGHGLAGMRERVELYGGKLTSSRRTGGGFDVHATIPLRTDPLDHRQASDQAAVGHSPGRRPVATAARWLTAVRPWSDTLLAGCWLIALELDALTDQYRRGPVAVNAAAVAIMAVAYAWRRRSPLLFEIVVGCAAFPLSSGLTSAHSTLTGFYCVTVPMFTVAAWRARTPAVAGLTLWIAGATVSGVVAHKPAAGIAGGLIASCLLWAAGRLWRGQRTLAGRLAQTHALLEAERDDRERLAIATERARIARELHGLVAEGVVAMIVQAAAARQTLRGDPDAAAAATRMIEQAGRDALARMRDILGVLRARQASAQVRPQPGLGQLHALIQRLREGGRTVELSIEGDPGPLPAGVDLTAYRIIEATLAAADARKARAVMVTVRFGGDGVEVDIAGGGLDLSRQLRLTVSERAELCHGTVLPPPGGDRVPRLLVRLPFSVPEVLPA
jgi:signal transduction histidine kinase